MKQLFEFCISKFKQAAGRKLSSIDCHDILCKIGEVVVVGGVRRSAMISLSDLEDDKMRACKSGSWWQYNPQRALANNSAMYDEKPDMSQFMKEWSSLYEVSQESVVSSVGQHQRDKLLRMVEGISIMTLVQSMQ